MYDPTIVVRSTPSHKAQLSAFFLLVSVALLIVTVTTNGWATGSYQTQAGSVKFGVFELCTDKEDGSGRICRDTRDYCDLFNAQLCHKSNSMAALLVSSAVFLGLSALFIVPIVIGQRKRPVLLPVTATFSVIGAACVLVATALAISVVHDLNEPQNTGSDTLSVKLGFDFVIGVAATIISLISSVLIILHGSQQQQQK